MTEPTRPCGTCGMPCTPGEYHPYAACLMFKACHNSETVRANLEAVRGTQPTQAQAGAVPLTDREIELIDGMIQVQLDHASRCDAIANRSMADKQKGWDMERVALLQKLKFHGIK